MSRRNYYLAARVVRDGVPELVKLLDSGEITTDAAAVIAAQPAERQREIVALRARARREEVRRLRQARVKVAKRPRSEQVSAARLAGEMARWSTRMDDARESVSGSRAGRERSCSRRSRGTGRAWPRWKRRWRRLRRPNGSRAKASGRKSRGSVRR